MNYRHHFHAGNFADVMKHALLLQLVGALQRKEKGFLYLDTHAGRGGYDLAAAAQGDSLARRPEWPEGIGRLWGRASADLEPLTRDYVEAVRAFDREHGNLESTPRFYPGSPALVRRRLRPQDRMALCERQPEECAALRLEMSRVARCTVQEMDGYGALRAMLPPPERRALVLIDPPFEAQGEFAAMVESLQGGLERLPAGVFALWYPLTDRARVEAFFERLQAAGLPPTLVAELAVAGEDSPLKMRGCGLVIVNPPWQFDRAAGGALGALAGALAQGPGAAGGCRWLVAER